MIQKTNGKKNILLVDDEKSLTQMLSMLLETRGYSVQVANSAEEALLKITPHVDLIILDLILPDIHGFEVCRRLREKTETQHIPIIMLSAQSLYEDRVQGLYMGADDFLPKPCEHEELFARMEVLMRRCNGNNGGKTNNSEGVVSELRKILDEALIVPNFQPIYAFNPTRLYGLEVLTRPQSEGLLANPEHFFNAAIQYGLYTDIEIMSWSLALAKLRHVVTKDLKVFLNCSPYFIESSQFARVRALVDKNSIPAEDVVLEITERSAITNYKLFFDHLYCYREYGFRIAIDDVGGGYASLQSIVETKPNIIKIDRQFIHAMQSDSFKRSIVKFVVGFCKENNIMTVAEGIEDQKDLDAVRDLGVDAGQGYYLYRPTPHLDIEQMSKVLIS